MTKSIINAFANPVRLKLLYCLSQGRKNVHELIGNCGLSQSAVSQHLNKLKEAGLVKDEKKGKFVFYSLTHTKTGELAKSLQEFIKEVKNEK